MECEYCAEMGLEVEATVKCRECDEWICDAHAVCTDAAHYLCPDCCALATAAPDDATQTGEAGDST